MKPVVFLLCLLFTIHSYSQKISPGLEEKIRLIENSLAPQIIYGDTLPAMNILKRMDTYNIKGLSIAVVKDYKIEWAKGYGWADAEEKRPVTTNTRFQAASISKSLNSLALLKLVQQGKIDLEGDINNYLKSWKFPYDSLSGNKKISLANLLSHTAGLTVHGFGGYETGTALPTVLQILNGMPPANSPAIRSQFETGKRFQYSGGGTTISQLILTDITGARYEEYLWKEVLKPIGMTNSFFNQPPAAGTKELATAYNNGVPVKGKYHVYPEQAAAGLWTTPTDLCKYIIETQLTFEGKPGHVLNTEIMRKRLSPYIDSSVGLGVFLINKSGNRFFSHNGGNEGFLCTYFGSMKDGNGVVIMINGNNFDVISELLNSVAKVYDWKNFYKPTFKKLYLVSKDTLTAYVGKYLMGRDTVSINFCGEELCIKQNGNPPAGLNMLFTTATEFSMREEPGLVLRMLYREGKVESLEINQNGEKIIAKKFAGGE